MSSIIERIKRRRSCTSKDGFAPYRATYSRISREQVFADVNARVFFANSPLAPAVHQRTIAYPLFAYAGLLEGLQAIPLLDVVTLEELCIEPGRVNRVRLAIRHDVDIDIVTALEMARLERNFGLRTSYYLLHTAPYYGVFRGQVFWRHRSTAAACHEIAALGHEIGLHTDPLTVYQKHGIDGAAAVAAEIEWLRELGMVVRGTVAHGSKTVFGAENFEIFKGRRKGKAKMTSAADDSAIDLEYLGTRARLRVLDEDALGLVYEGNDVFWQRTVPMEYGAARALDQWRWNAHRRERMTGEAATLPLEFCSQERVLRDIARLKPGYGVVLTIHPVYYGARISPRSAPLHRLRNLEIKVNPRFGWDTYVPNGVQCWSNADTQMQTFQTINRANHIGFLDCSINPQRSDVSDTRLLILGGDNLDGRDVAVTSQFQSVLRTLSQEHGSATEFMKLAFANMGIGRYWGWYEEVAHRWRPDVVILGISTQEVRLSIPALWSVETGYSLRHPPGDYLAWEASSDSISLVRRSSGWRARQRKPIVLKFLPGSDVSIEDALVADLGRGDTNCASFQAISAMFRHATLCIRRSGAKAFLLVSDNGEAAGWLDPTGLVIERDKIERFQQRVEEIARVCAIPVINPYPRFARAAQNGEYAWHANGRWNHLGHRMVAQEIWGMTRKIAPREFADE